MKDARLSVVGNGFVGLLRRQKRSVAQLINIRIELWLESIDASQRMLRQLNGRDRLGADRRGCFKGRTEMYSKPLLTSAQFTTAYASYCWMSQTEWAQINFLNGSFWLDVATTPFPTVLSVLQYWASRS